MSWGPGGTALRRRSVLPAAVLAITLGVVGGLAALAPVVELAGASGAAVPADRAVVPSEAALSFGARAGYSPSYAADVQDAHPASGPVPVTLTFRAPLTPEAYANALAYFRNAGLTVVMTDPGRLSVEVRGEAATVGAAFATDVESGMFQGSPVLFPSAPPALPAPLEGEVAGIVGLRAGFAPFTFDLTPLPQPAGGVLPDGPGTMTPALARDLYQLSPLYNLSGGANGTTYPVDTAIAVVLWGAGYSPSDLQAFFANDYPTSFPQPKIHYYTIDGAPAPSDTAPDTPDARAVEELTLDIEWAASIAPGATIDAVYAPNGPPPSFSPSNADLTAAFAEALSLNVSVVSMSFGTDESSDAGLVGGWAPLLNEAESKGITVVAATGDSGGASSPPPACSGPLAPQYPASSPQVVAVGGTTVSISTGVLGSVSFTETGWNDSGGGFSTQFTAPSWQEVGSAAAPIGASGHRGMPDVSATAADNYLYFNGTSAAAAGTSFATPLWGGLFADMDAKSGLSLGFITPRLYHVGAVEPSGAIGDGLVDVVGSANCVGSAGPGWDVVTGWGSPRANVLYEDLLGSFVNITLDVGQTTIPPGGSVAVSAQLTNRTTHAPLVGVQVNLSLASDTDLGPCTGQFASSSPTTNATGWVSSTFSVPLCYLGQHALANASVMTTKLYGIESVKVNVNLLGFDPALVFLEQPPFAYVTYAVIVGAAAVGGVWLGRPREPSRPATVRVPRAAPSPPSPPAPPPTAPPSGPSGAPPGPGPPLPPAPSGPAVEPAPPPSEPGTAPPPSGPT